VSKAQRRAMATSAAMINLMLGKSEKSAGCSVQVILRHSLLCRGNNRVTKLDTVATD
jgi:hypothetical protein